jgi:hypothetical protein
MERPASDEERHGWPGRVAVALTREDPPRVFIAESESVLSRVVALRLVAQTAPRDIAIPSWVADIRQALLEGRWSDAVFGWMDATGVVIDAYPDELVWTSQAFDDERTSMEVRMAPLFEDR